MLNDAFNYYLADQDNFARVFRTPKFSDEPLEFYHGKEECWKLTTLESVADIWSQVRPLPVSELAAEIRICKLIQRGARAVLKVQHELNQQYANN